jgi:hypothetical protein
VTKNLKVRRFIFRVTPSYIVLRDLTDYLKIDTAEHDPLIEEICAESAA